MIKTKRTIIKIDSWINIKLNHLAWYNKMAIVFLVAILSSLIRSLI